jgi:hypothetical protein
MAAETFFERGSGGYLQALVTNTTVAEHLLAQ